jgi:hypothetical protein
MARNDFAHLRNQKSWRSGGSLILLLAALWAYAGYALLAADFDPKEEQQFRLDREAWMKSSASPLALAGLYWLKQGPNSFGTDAKNNIILPPGTAPAYVGKLALHGLKVQLQVENPEAKVLLKKVRIQSRELKSDAGGGPADVLELNDLRLKIIERSDKTGLRLINLKNPPLMRASPLDFFPASPQFRTLASFTPYTPAKKIKIASVIGTEEEMICPGIVRFQLGGQEYSLEPVAAPGEPLFFIFKDRTNGKETYGGGRFLLAPPPKEGKVVLDFNMAHNPYCAYSSFATCPMPPPQNWLKVRIPAGEKKYPGKTGANKTGGQKK